MGSLSFTFIGKSPLGRLLRVLVFFATGSLSLLTVDAHAMGKMYSEQGAKFADAMHTALVSKGLCKTTSECYDLLPRTIETDSKVFIQFYAISKKNHPAFLSVVALALTDGMRITEGAPITIEAFHETHDVYRRSGLVIKDVKPFSTIEVSK